jgi:hypothetical protein
MGDKKDTPLLLPRFIYNWHTHLGDNIKMDLKQTEGESVIRIQMLQDTRQWKTSGQTNTNGNETLDFVTSQEVFDELRDYKLPCTDLLSNKSFNFTARWKCLRQIYHKISFPPEPFRIFFI